ncbi:MAG TPA: hypothetical protein VF862_11170 [Gemmatimonadales bacterium]
MRRSFLPLLALTALAAAPAAAQTGFGPVVGLNVAAGSFGEYFGAGWTLGAQYIKGLPFGSLMFEAAYNGFSIVDDLTDLEAFDDDLNLWGFAAGPRLGIGPFNVGALGSYHTEVDEFDVIPMAGINIWKLDVALRYKGLFGDANWAGLTAAFLF